MNKKVLKIIFSVALLSFAQSSFGALRECVPLCSVANDKIVRIELNAPLHGFSGELTKYIYDSDHDDIEISYIGDVFSLLMNVVSGETFGFTIYNPEFVSDGAQGDMFEVDHKGMAGGGKYTIVSKNIVKAGMAEDKQAYEIKDLQMDITSDFPLIKDGKISVHAR